MAFLKTKFCLWTLCSFILREVFYKEQKTKQRLRNREKKNKMLNLPILWFFWKYFRMPYLKPKYSSLLDNSILDSVLLNIIPRPCNTGYCLLRYVRPMTELFWNTSASPRLPFSSGQADPVWDFCFCGLESKDCLLLWSILVVSVLMKNW